MNLDDLKRAACCAVLAGLAACQHPDAAVPPPPGPEAAASEPTGKAGLATIPPCAEGVTATLNTGMVVRFDGSAGDDPAVCVQHWEHQAHRYYLGFWGNGRFHRGSPEQRTAVAAALRAPVGAAVSFALVRKTPVSLWKSATVEHIANERVKIGSRDRRAVKLRVVLRDALNRRGVQAERLYWIDRATGIPLRKVVVTHTADGGRWRTTTWQVVSLRSDAAVPGNG